LFSADKMMNGDSEKISTSDNVAQEPDPSFKTPGHDDGVDMEQKFQPQSVKRTYTKKHKTKILNSHHHLKKCLLKSLVMFSPDPENFPKIIDKQMLYSVTPAAVTGQFSIVKSTLFHIKTKFIDFPDYLNSFAEKSESEYVKIQKDETFQNLQGWSDYMTELHAKPNKNDLVLALKAIAETEKHPEPGKVNGVDFK
jgi:hypothetical protein